LRHGGFLIKPSYLTMCAVCCVITITSLGPDRHKTRGYLICCEYSPHPAANGPSTSKSLRLSHGVCVDSLAMVPGSEAALSTGTLQPVTRIQGNMTALYHRYSESRCNHTHTSYLSLHDKNEYNCLLLENNESL
jgi:hypothetical protein